MATDANGYDDLRDFTKETRTFNGKTKPVYYQGSGPGVVVMTEMPGIQPTVADFARRVVDLGCTVAMPSLFGDDGRRASSGYAMKSILKGCVTREFAAFSRKKSPPVATWMQALCRDLHGDVGGPGVGLIGMCWTGGFALATMVDPVVVAPVLSQPSLPLAITKKHKAALHLSAADLQIVKERANNGCSVLGLRFSNDGMSPGERFATLEAELGEGFIGVEIDSGPGNPNDLSHRAHSVVTEHLQDIPGHPTRDALDQVLDLFRERLELSA